MATLVRNKHATPVTLPYPYSGVLPGGGAAVLAGEPAEVLLNMGSQVEQVFELHPVSDSELNISPVNGTYVAPVGPLVAAMVAAKMYFFENIAAKSATSVHANVRGDAVNTIPGPFTSPAYPRNLRMVFGAAWDGGNVTITGTSPTDAVITEVITGTASTTQVGVKVFKTVTAAVKAAVGIDAAGTNVASIGTGDKLWAGFDLTVSFGVFTAGGVMEAVTLDTTYDAFTPTTVPDGAVDYVLLVNVTPASV